MGEKIDTEFHVLACQAKQKAIHAKFELRVKKSNTRQFRTKEEMPETNYSIVEGVGQKSKGLALILLQRKDNRSIKDEQMKRPPLLLINFTTWLIEVVNYWAETSHLLIKCNTYFLAA